jgi:copper resistance protein B
MVEARTLRAGLAAITVLALCTAAGAQPPPAHAMLEDPFNRAVRFDVLELHDGDDARWDASVSAGYTFNRVTLRSEGERAGGTTQHAELELLWTHAAARWWDVVAGARADLGHGPSRTWAAFGVQGLAPRRFELEATAFVADGGDTAARIEGERDFLITPRLILEPRIEIDWYGQKDAPRRRGSGLSSVEAGLRLRYELEREVAPYVGLVRERRFGGTADFARSAGLDPDDSSLVAGVRLRF